MNSLLDDSVEYEDIVLNWKNRYHWKDWNRCLWIASNIPNSKLGLCGEARVRLFTNNFKLEEAVERYLGIHFADLTHLTLHTGSGKPTPDFTDDEGKTYELKSRRNRKVAPPYWCANWYNADVHLLYERETNHLLIQHQFGEFEDLGELKGYQPLED